MGGIAFLSPPHISITHQHTLILSYARLSCKWRLNFTAKDMRDQDLHVELPCIKNCLPATSWKYISWKTYCTTIMSLMREAKIELSLIKLTLELLLNTHISTRPAGSLRRSFRISLIKILFEWRTSTQIQLDLIIRKQFIFREKKI